MPQESDGTKGAMLVLLGALVGGVVGFFVFGWVITQGLYALVAPGGLIGLGAGIARTRQKWVATVCGAGALMLSFFCEWHFFPFIVDPSLGYFLAHLGNLRPFTWISIGVGTLIAFWMPFSRSRK